MYLQSAGLNTDPSEYAAKQVRLKLVEAGLLPPGLADAYRLLSRFLVTVRLVAPDLQVPSDPIRALIARACDQPDWEGLLAALDAARQSVSEAWRAICASPTGD